MSYARGPESDVYVFGSGTYLECIVNHESAEGLGIPQFHAFKYRKNHPGSAQREMVGLLQTLRFMGLRVPEHAFARLYTEIWDVMDGGWDEEFERNEAAAAGWRSRLAEGQLRESVNRGAAFLDSLDAGWADKVIDG